MTFPIAPIKTPDAKPALQQIWEMINLGARMVSTPTDYETYRLYQRGKTTRDALKFISGPRAYEICKALNTNTKMLESKVEYDIHYRSLGLPVPSTLAVIGNLGRDTEYPQLTTRESVHDFLASSISRGQHIVLKKVHGLQGIGVMVIIDLLGVEGRNFLLLSNGTTKPLDETITSVLSEGAWLVQERLQQHEIFTSLNPTSLNTIRVGTFLNRDGSVNVEYAVSRLGREYSQIDAYAAGGVAVRIDVQTGQLAEFGQQKIKYSPDPVTHHPDSNVRLAAIQIPFWDQVLRLAKDFAVNANGNRFIGWDVAITPTGPVFVEGNWAWDAHLAQVGGVGLLSDEFVSRMQDESDLELSNTELPKIKLDEAIRMVRKKF